MANLKLIVGLGNPGPQYADTRHNVGAWLTEMIAASHGEAFKTHPKLFGELADIRQPSPYRLFIPHTFMNESGKALAAITQFYKIAPNEVLIAHDELDLAPGIIRLKFSGGHGGHNGLRDIIKALGTNEFYRVRIGIGHPGHKDKVTPFVLSAPSKADKMQILKAMVRFDMQLDDVLAGDIEKVMRELHKKET